MDTKTSNQNFLKINTKPWYLCELWVIYFVLNEQGILIRFIDPLRIGYGILWTTSPDDLLIRCNLRTSLSPAAIAVALS